MSVLPQTFGGAALAGVLQVRVKVWIGRPFHRASGSDTSRPG